jgi:subtilisin
MEADSWQQAAWVRLTIGVMASVALVAGVAFAAHAPTANRKIVVFREGTARQLHRQVVERHGHKVLRHLDLLKAVVIGLDDHAEMASAALESDPWVAGVYEDHQISADHMVVISPVAAPPAELFPWGVGHIGVPGVFALIASEAVSAPTVAILDTGIDPSHPELLPHLAGGYNARAGEDPSNYQDYNGHGTHMAGIIAAELNGAGIIGTATDPKLVAVKVLDDTGHGYVSDLVYALQWVLKNRIRVVNMSLSFSAGSPPLEQVIDQLYAAGVIMVASAGNRCVGGAGHDGADDEGGDSGCDAPSAAVKYPAAYRGVVAVVATDIDRKLTDYNRSGPEVGLAAPGGSETGEILSLTCGGYGLGRGSSQAAAHVTGGVVVALQLAPRLSVDQVVELLKGTARDLGYSEPHQGAGLLAVDNIVKNLLGLP